MFALDLLIAQESDLNTGNPVHPMYASKHCADTMQLLSRTVDLGPYGGSGYEDRVVKTTQCAQGTIIVITGPQGQPVLISNDLYGRPLRYISLAKFMGTSLLLNLTPSERIALEFFRILAETDPFIIAVLYPYDGS